MPEVLASDSLRDALDQRAISGVLTSASSLPEKDMTEKHLWQWAEARGLPSIAILDQWQSYVERFSGPNGTQRLGYMPDVIAVMDDLAVEEMKREGFSATKLAVTGQPALETVQQRIERARRSPRSNPKVPGTFQVTFFSQPIRELFGDSLGYDELSVLQAIRTSVQMLGDAQISVVCKLHPKNHMADFPTTEADVCLVQGDASNEALLAESDLVIGISSIMLSHSVLAGIPTLCYEPAETGLRNRCAPVSFGAIPRCASESELVHALLRLRRDPEFRLCHLEQQQRFPTHTGATQNVIALVARMLP